MAYEASNGHVTDDVTQPQKVKLVTLIRLEPQKRQQIEMAVRSAILAK